MVEVLNLLAKRQNGAGAAGGARPISTRYDGNGLMRTFTGGFMQNQRIALQRIPLHRIAILSLTLLLLGGCGYNSIQQKDEGSKPHGRK